MENSDKEILTFDHNYMKIMWQLTPYVDNIVQYIARYICNRLYNIINCEIYKNQLDEKMPLLSKFKNRVKNIFKTI